MAIPIPEGYSAAPYPLSADDHGGWAVVASSVGLLFVLLFACIRLWIRNPLRSTLVGDDIALFAATVSAVIQSILIIAAADHGLGLSKLLGGAKHVQADKLLYSSDAFFLVALFLSKISVLHLELRISPERWHILLAKGGLATCAAALVACLVMVLVGCGSQPWNILASLNAIASRLTSTSQYDRWIVVFAIDAFFELYIFALILRMLAALQRKTRNKLTAFTMFGLRLPVIIFAALRLTALSNFRTSTEPLFDRVIVVVWTQTELAYSLAAATIPTLIPFLTELNTGLGAFDARGDMIRQTQMESSRHVGGSYGLQMQSMQGKSASRASQSDAQIRGDLVAYKSSVVSPQADQRSVGSDDSTRVIIRKTVDVSFSPAPYDAAGT